MLATPCHHGRPGGLPFVLAAALAIAAAPALCRADTPMAYTYGFGTKNYPVVNQLEGLIILSLLVVAIIGILVLVGSLVRRAAPPSGDLHDVPLLPAGRGLGFIYIGTALTVLALFGFAAWTFATLAAISGPKGGKAALSIHVIGHQWWWEVRYLGGDTGRTFETANEIHIPTGKPVRVQLTSVDVIHSFWVPQLSGKMDLIPGQQNETWIEADRPGIYRGQCAEYCGLQHAHMALVVVAQPPQQFDGWWAGQLKGAPAPRTALQAEGERQFIVRCGACHTVDGTAAHGRFGPNLSHLMSRRTIAAGTLPNTIGYLSGWIADPQHVKPGNYMPQLDLSGPQLTAIRNFLETLK
ncbi:MAG TPA: cytochrome c oxidase subunit II [Stellaceae bacterium]|nr:cytochrome c oxidase subunit II [Stellaceae bacterium]